MDTVPVPPDAGLLKGFWARSSAAVAVVATFEFLWCSVEPAVVAALGERASVLLRVACEAWMLAFGFNKASPSARVG